MLVHVVDATGRSDRDGNALGGGESGEVLSPQFVCGNFLLESNLCFFFLECFGY